MRADRRREGAERKRERGKERGERERGRESEREREVWCSIFVITIIPLLLLSILLVV